MILSNRIQRMSIAMSMENQMKICSKEGKFCCDQRNSLAKNPNCIDFYIFQDKDSNHIQLLFQIIIYQFYIVTQFQIVNLLLYFVNIYSNIESL